MEPSYPAIQFISLGPGDPELITLKGLKALQEASSIYCPGTRSAAGIPSSYAANTLRALGIGEEKIKTFTLPMNKHREAALQVYHEVAAQIEEDYREGQKIAVAAEGDAGFYASVQYLYELLENKGLPVRRIAGIPAFIAAGPVAGLHLAKQEERLLVIPGLISAEELAEKLQSGYVLVIMKLPLCAEAVRQCIDSHPEAAFHYFENISRANEFYTSDPAIIKEKKFPYFSLMVIGPASNG